MEIENIPGTREWIDKHCLELVNPIQAAKFLGISLERLKEMRDHGSGPTYYKYWFMIRYLISDLEIFQKYFRERL